MEAVTRGWLNTDYRIFRSVDRRNMDFDMHYHEFHKIVFCLGGCAEYAMEGKTYRLTAGSILIVPRHCIHRSSFQQEDAYERMILWVQDDYIRSFGDESLCALFENREPYFLTPAHAEANRLETVLANAYGSEGLLSMTYLLQFLLFLYRVKAEEPRKDGTGVQDPFIRGILEHIRENIRGRLSVQSIADAFYISPSYLMHRFKKETGFPLYNYILQKRLILAVEAMQNGTPVQEAARESGFTDYTAFLKAFKAYYGKTPTEIRTYKAQ